MAEGRTRWRSFFTPLTATGILHFSEVLAELASCGILRVSWCSSWYTMMCLSTLRSTNVFVVLSLRFELMIRLLPWYLIAFGAMCFSSLRKSTCLKSTTSA